MISKLKIIPLGGLGEIGKNMTAFEFGSDIIVVDCGMGFPDEDMYGIDIVLPDISYLKSNAARVRGIILTHGHEDHIGAVPYVLRELDVPIYTTPLTAALVELKLEEHDLLYISLRHFLHDHRKYRIMKFYNHWLDWVGLLQHLPLIDDILNFYLLGN